MKSNLNVKEPGRLSLPGFFQPNICMDIS